MAHDLRRRALAVTAALTLTAVVILGWRAGVLGPPAAVSTSDDVPAPVAGEVATQRSGTAGSDAGAGRQEAAAGPAVAPPELVWPRRLRVVTEAGVAVVGADVLLCPSAWNRFEHEEPVPHVRTRTGDDGIALVPEADAKFDTVAVSAAGHAAFAARLAAAGDEQLLTLPIGATVTGRVTIGGVAPPAPMVLIVHCHSLPAWWPPAVAAALEAIDASAPERRIATDGAGRFAIQGLPAEVALCICWQQAPWVPPEYVSAGGGGVTVQTPAADVVLAIRRFPRITGRLVGAFPNWADGRCRIRYEQWEIACRIGEPFAVSIGERTNDKYVVEILQGGERAWPETVLARREVAGPMQADVDVGEVAVALQVRRLDVRVCDEARQPIPDVRLSGHGLMHPILVATGSAQLSLPACCKVLQVRAPGWRPRDVRLPGPSPAPLEIVLVPSNLLRVRVAPADGGAPLTGLWLCCQTTPSGRSLVWPDHAPFDLSVTAYGTRDGLPWLRVPVRAAAEQLFGNVTGRALLHVTDAYGTVLNETVVEIGEREQVDVPIFVRERSRRLWGRIVDGEGRSANAWLTLGDGFRPEAEVHTDEGGRFLFRDVYAASPRLRIHADVRELVVEGPELFTRREFVFREQ